MRLSRSNASLLVAVFFCEKFEFLLRNTGHRVFVRFSKFIKSLWTESAFSLDRKTSKVGSICIYCFDVY